MDFELSEEQRAFQDSARSFAESELAPHAAGWDEHCEFPVGDAARGGRARLRRHLRARGRRRRRALRGSTPR